MDPDSQRPAEHDSTPLEDQETLGPASDSPAGRDAPGGREATPVIDRYRLSGRLGAGGMGEVWLAEQLVPVRRRVAVKIIKTGMDTAEVLARFDAERQALALMDHPAIAKVLDAGSTSAGRPYFVMEHVDGIPITEHCDRNHLSLEERLRLFLEVCAGVQHAHQKAVIHRDLKPSNILVSVQDGRPVPKIIDFGLAKAIGASLTHQSLHTQLGAMIGTPGYMSPEQALLTGEDVDTRTDVYALGVVLYELLTGTLPFDPQKLKALGYEGLWRMISEEEVPRPSARLGGVSEQLSREAAEKRQLDATSLRRGLGGDLDWITMKALEKDRARRYGSPAELADDTRRYLRHEPVLAGPPDALYRFRKFVRRHRLGVAVAATVVLALACGLVGATIGLLRARRAEAAARAEAATSERVSRLLTDLLGTVDPERMGNDIVSDLRTRAGAALAAGGESQQKVAAALGSLDAALAGVNRTDAALGILDKEILSRAAKTIEAEVSKDPLIAARLQLTIAQTYRRLGLYQQEEQLARQAYETRRRVLGVDHPDSLESASNLTVALTDLGRMDEAVTLQRDILDRRRRLLGAEDPGTLASLHNLAWMYQATRREKEAVPLYEETLKSRRHVLGPDDQATLRTMNNLANAYSALGRVEDALRLSAETLEIRRRVLGPENPDTLASMNNLAYSYFDVGRLEDAAKLQREALAVRRRMQGRDHPDTLAAMLNLSQTLLALGNYDEAAQVCEEELRTNRAKLGPAHPDTLLALADLGRARRGQGRAQEAADLLAEAHQGLKAALGPGDSDTLATLEGLAKALAALGRTEAARVATREMLFERRQKAESANAEASMKNRYASALLTCVPEDLQDPAEALRVAGEAAAATQDTDAGILDTLALAYHRLGRTGEAVETQRKAISLLPSGASTLRTDLEKHLAEFEAARKVRSTGDGKKAPAR